LIHHAPDVGRICYAIGVEISIEPAARTIATSVRRAQLSDITVLAELINRAYAVEASFIDGQRTSAAELATLIPAGGFLVLEYAGGIAASVRFLAPGQQRDVPPGNAYFGMLSVLPELQGLGLGRRLVQVAEAMAEATGATAMSLRVINLREELTRWYKSLGYREVGTSPYNHRATIRPCHFIEMAKPLAPVSAHYAGRAIGAA